jgi:hypothetical protein
VRMRDGCKWLGCYSVVGFVSRSVGSVGFSYQSYLFCETHDREMCCEEDSCLDLSQKHVKWWSLVLAV